jgi:ribosome-associated toxin RatA of RatAB toxin-antitoxin module
MTIYSNSPSLAAPEPQVNHGADSKADHAKHNGHLAESTMTMTVKAPIDLIWNALVNFEKYPEIFDRISSVNVTKRDDNKIYVESHLKPQLFVKTEIQHTINDVSGKPEVLRWHQMDGNFKDVHGEWYLKPLSATSTQVKYHLAADPGPVIPAPLVSFVLHCIQKEIVAALAKYTQHGYETQEKAQSL